MAETKKKTSASAKTAAKAENTETAVKEEKIIPKDIDLNQYITVRNGFHGKLVYKSSRTGEKFIWDEYGSEQEMELKELRNAKNTSKRFFIDNWFMFDEDWIIDYLGVRQYYRNAVSIEDYDKLFKKTPAEIKKTILDMSPGQKRSVMYRANELIVSGEIDSRKIISALEEALGVELIEK